MLVDALVAWSVLRRGDLDLPRLLFAGACGALVVFGQAALAVVLLGRGFLAVRVLHVWLFWVVPAVCLLVLLVARRRGATSAARVLAATGALALPGLLVWTSLVEPFDLRLERADVPLPPDRAPDVPLRVAVFSDLQCESIGAHERAAVALLMAQHPDLILIPGDLYQVFTRADLAALQAPLRALLAELEAPLGVFAVCGNCDGREQLEPLFRGTRVQLLYDETVHLRHGGRGIALCGVRLSASAPPALAALAALEAPRGDELRLVLAHVPDVALELPPDTRVDLVVAGHTHGGQVCLPWIGPPFTLSRVPGNVAAGGLHGLGGTRIYVSRGIGVERGDAPRVRFNCPPEVSLLTLR